MRRAGAVTLENSERVTVSGCAFVRTDANAILLNAYNRTASVLDSDFQWLGMSAIALLGDTEQDDGTAALQPWGTLVAGCAFSELGVVEKQSSALFIGKAALTRFEANLAWNMPRGNWEWGGGGPRERARERARASTTLSYHARSPPSPGRCQLQRRPGGRPQRDGQ